ncbi:MAG: CDP-alcohol phosphatidyltransferase family protein [Anaerolineae bacterium]|nr:CDP-alcohol phosphatidyltransferase family protein [Anaerolineae bacterium]
MVLEKQHARITFDDWLRARAAVIIHPLARWLGERRLHPNTITILGFVLTAGASVIIGSGRLRLGAVAMLVASATDALDGTLARLTSQQSRFGAFLDSTLDRLSEGAVLIGLLTWFVGQRLAGAAILTAVALLGSVMVSYTRARAEGLGYTCKVGILTRPMRVILLGVGMLSPWLVPTLVILAVLTWATSVQRIVHVYRESRLNP